MTNKRELLPPLDELKVGETYSMVGLGLAMGGVMVTPDDRIVTEELGGQRLTAGRLRAWLDAALVDGLISEDTEIFATQDPEGNGFHPLCCTLQLGMAGERAPGVWDFDEDSYPVEAALLWAGY